MQNDQSLSEQRTIRLAALRSMRTLTGMETSGTVFNYADSLTEEEKYYYEKYLILEGETKYTSDIVMRLLVPLKTSHPLALATILDLTRILHAYSNQNTHQEQLVEVLTALLPGLIGHVMHLSRDPHAQPEDGCAGGPIGGAEAFNGLVCMTANIMSQLAYLDSGSELLTPGGVCHEFVQQYLRRPNQYDFIIDYVAVYATAVFQSQGATASILLVQDGLLDWLCDQIDNGCARNGFTINSITTTIQRASQQFTYRVASLTGADTLDDLLDAPQYHIANTLPAWLHAADTMASILISTMDLDGKVLSVPEREVGVHTPAGALTAVAYLAAVHPGLAVALLGNDEMIRRVLVIVSRAIMPFDMMGILFIGALSFYSSHAIVEQLHQTGLLSELARTFIDTPCEGRYTNRLVRMTYALANIFACPSLPCPRALRAGFTEHMRDVLVTNPRLTHDMLIVIENYVSTDNETIADLINDGIIRVLGAATAAVAASSTVRVDDVKRVCDATKKVVEGFCAGPSSAVLWGAFVDDFAESGFINDMIQLSQLQIPTVQNMITEILRLFDVRVSSEVDSGYGPVCAVSAAQEEIMRPVQY